MKLATVTYDGPMRTVNRSGPSGTNYRFSQPTNTDQQPVSVSSLEDAEEFAALDVFDVEWTPQGRVARMAGGPVAEAGSILRDLSYRQKQRLISALDVDVKGNAPEDELTEALRPTVEQMTEQMETQR